MVRYVLVDEMKNTTIPLEVGKNLVRRHTTQVKKDASVVLLDPAYRNVSRTHAVIDVWENGDVWLQDCKSTNGTYFCGQTGNAERLQPGHCYQLKPRNYVIFADVRLRFDVEVAPVCKSHDTNNKTATWEGCPPEPVPPTPQSAQPDSTRNTSSDNHCATNWANPFSPVSTVYNLSASLPTSRNTDQCNIVLMRQGSPSTWAPSLILSVASAPLTADITPRMKRCRENHGNDLLRSDTKGNEVPPTTAVEEGVETRRQRRRAFHVCFSGIMPQKVCIASSEVVSRGWKVVDDIRRANLLVVGIPATRTPKFLIAVGRGIPIVTEAFLYCGGESCFRSFVPTLTHNGHTFEAHELHEVILKNKTKPALKGMTYSLGLLPIDARATAEMILTFCGARITSKGVCRKGTVQLTRDSLHSLYDGMLRGDVSL
uniref:WGS project CAEQ00000000 data, annotated contig 1518 n=1 Tax=Trypanosoma congolense (strain IL3000) TaxID=1068625 RepID=F9W6S7_TRYCI|nr:unnamed protein product [Trypanosoma congolense IL3000]